MQPRTVMIGGERQGHHGGSKIGAADAGIDDIGEAPAVGSGDARQFLLLTLAEAGGQLKVEPAARSGNPLAAIAASYAGLMDALGIQNARVVGCSLGSVIAQQLALRPAARTV